MLINALLVGAGGFIGSVGRYLLGGWVHRMSGQHWFPFGTLSVNVLGCFAIGFLSGLVESRWPLRPELSLFLFVGVLGGFTTFSTFSAESTHLLRNAQSVAALLNIVLHVILSLSVAWFGHYLTKIP